MDTALEILGKTFLCGVGFSIGTSLVILVIFLCLEALDKKGWLDWL